MTRLTTATVDPGDLPAAAAELLARGHRLALVSATHRGADDPRGEAIHAAYVFLAPAGAAAAADTAAAGAPPGTDAGTDARAELIVELDPADPELPSLAHLSFPCSRFERELRDQFGITPLGHPQPRPLVRHPAWPEHYHPLRADAGPVPPFDPHPEPFPFLTVEGPGVYEVPVGPIHAGLIEPGHFRFSVVGESILKLKARLWYAHRGIEKLFHGRRPEDGIALAERISGDTAVGHSLTYVRAIEDATGTPVPEEAETIRALLLELERLYNHAADLGALCSDVGHGVLNAHGGRIREQLLRLNKDVTGHRLLRGAVHIGGARLLALPDVRRLRSLADEVAELTALALNHSVVRDRFTGTAVLSSKQAEDLGTLGYVARASGLATDARRDHPATPALSVPRAVMHTSGDVLARFQQRAEEYAVSTAYATDLCERIADLAPHTPGSDTADVSRARPSGVGSGLGISEGWRGTVVHRIELGPDGRLDRVKIVDPSFFNWPALPLALAGVIVPDFPLSNKSFNLSYAGNDL